MEGVLYYAQVVGMFQELLKDLFAFPRRGQIQINFCSKEKTFSLSVPIFSSRSLSPSVKTYVEARKNKAFKPHATSFDLEESGVVLTQEFPFELGFQETLRQRVDAFWKLSRHCHQMMRELAIEEAYQEVLDADFPE